MFDKFKQAGDLIKMRNQAKKLQEELEKITHIEDKDGIKVRVNGAQQVMYIEINGEERRDLVEVINKAMKEVQKEAAKKMLEMGGGLSGLLGGMGQ